MGGDYSWCNVFVICFVMQAQLEMIVSANGLSENVYEIASKSLAD